MTKDGVPFSVRGAIAKISLQTKSKRKFELICFALQGIITVNHHLEVRYGLFILR